VSVLSDTGRVLAERRAPSLGTHLVTRLRESSSTGPISAAAFVQVRLRTAPIQSPYSPRTVPVQRCGSCESDGKGFGGEMSSRGRPLAKGSSTTVSRSDIRLIQHFDSPAHGLARRGRPQQRCFPIHLSPHPPRHVCLDTCLPRPEAPRHVSSGRSRAQRRARTRYTHLDPGDVHPTPHTRTTLSRAGKQPTQLTQPCNYTVVHHYRYT
jgi:hypothetical protein